ncbi:Heat shock transcription factor, partial [Coemansia sp. RSA 1836]
MLPSVRDMLAFSDCAPTLSPQRHESTDDSESTDEGSRGSGTPSSKQRPGRKAGSNDRYPTTKNVRQYRCGIHSCAAVFKRPEHLKRHMLTHTQVRPFQCEAKGCGKRFSRRDNYITHTKKHMMDPEYPDTPSHRHTCSDINSDSSTGSSTPAQAESTALPPAVSSIFGLLNHTTTAAATAMSGTVARRGGGNLHRSITVTPFLNKLYRMVDDGSSDDLIRWSEDGNSFVVLRHEEFAKEVLPRFFKHSNFSSFVRQLNMYDFHKVPHLQQGGLIADGPEAESWEFSNGNFQRGQPDLLHFIRRKKGTRDTTPYDQDAANGPADEESLALNDDEADEDEDESGDAGNRAVPIARERSTPARTNALRSATPAPAGTAKARASRTPPATLAQILKEIQVIRDHQLTISSDIKRLQEENQSLWIQASTAEERHKQHQYTIDNILQFLATVFRGDARQSEIHPPLRRLIMNSSSVVEDDDGNNSDARTYQGQAQRQQRQSSRSSGYATPTTGAAGFAGHTQDIFEGTDLADMLGNSQQQSQSPPEKRPRTGSARTSRIYEMSSNASSSAEPASQGSPPNGASGRQSAQRIGNSNTTTVRRKVPSPQSTALTRTQNRPLIAGAQLPPVFSNAASSSALVPLAGPSLSTISSRTKSIEQLQQEIDSLGVSLDHLTRQLHSGANRDATPDPLLSSFGGSAASAPTMTASAADMMLQSLSTSKADINSLLTPEALNDLAVALTAPNTTLSSHGLGSTVSSGLSRTSMAHLSGYRGNPPTAAPIFDPSAAAISA